MFRSIVHAEPNLLTHISSCLTWRCIGLLSVVIFLGPWLAASDPVLLDFLLPPPDCAAPCFLGVKPGVTTLGESLQQLSVSPLIRSISHVPPYSAQTSLSDLYNVEFNSMAGAVWSGRIRLLTPARSDIIESILLLSNDFELSDITLAFGQPDSFILDDRYHTDLVTYVGFYPQYQMYVRVVIEVCALGGSKLWHGQYHSILIGIGNESHFAKMADYYPLDARQKGEGWAHQVYAMKQVNCS